MKKFYVLFVVCLMLAFASNAQYTWTGGGAIDNWSDPLNWTGGAGFPDGAADDVSFNSAVTVNLDVPDLSINSIHITGSVTVRIVSDNDILGISDNTLTLNSQSGLTPALNIDAGSTLQVSVKKTSADGQFLLVFADKSVAGINGKLYFTSEADNDFTSLIIPAAGASATGTAININNGGNVEFTGRSYSPFDYDAQFFRFNAGSTLQLSGSDGIIVPAGTYNVASTVLVSGDPVSGLTFEQVGSIGNMTYNCSGQQDTVGLELGNAVTIAGNLSVLNTNNKPVVLATFIGTSDDDAIVNVNISGNLTIQGSSSVLVTKTAVTTQSVNLNIGGTLTAGGTAFNLQTKNNPAISPVTVFIKGNIQHTSGTFTASSTLINESANKFIVEMNGNAAQTISSFNGTINNAGNQIALRINNSGAGVTLLSPLTVGRLNFITGKLFTSTTNVLTINNSSGNAIVSSGASNAGFVSGPVNRRTASVNPLTMPTGKASTLRETIIIPEGASATTYQAEAFAGQYSDASVIAPLSGIAPYYYEVSRISGTENAAIRLPFSAAVSGAAATDMLLTAKYNSTDWINARGMTGTSVIPGNSASGSVTSELQTAFGLYTIGFGSQGALPTYLLSFRAKKASESSAVLYWKTTNNSTPERFEIMRSEDGVQFTQIGSVAGVENKLDYQFTDSRLSSGNNHYRLKMVDKDGVVTYTNILVVMNGANGVIISSLMPTMVKDRTRLSVSASLKGNLQLVITDINGRIIAQQSAAISAGSQEIWLNAAHLSGGIYQVTGYINGGQTKTFRFIKQ